MAEHEDQDKNHTDAYIVLVHTAEELSICAVRVHGPMISKLTGFP